MAFFHSHRPKKSLGQNFLSDPNYSEKIVDAVIGESPFHILEIGPGKGVLTRGLASHAEHLWLIEKDNTLALRLKEEFQGRPVSVINEDFMEVDLARLFGGLCKPVTVVGNLPYNVASQIFIKLIGNHKFFDRFYLMFQKEVAARLVARPGTKDYGLLSLWAQIYTEPNILFHLPPTVFFPQPKINSSLVRFEVKKTPELGDDEAPEFFSLMRHLFQHRRKTIASVLKKKLPMSLIEELPLKEKTRAEALSVPELITLFRRMPRHS